MSVLPFGLYRFNPITSQFVGEQSLQHGGYLHWNVNVGGFPLRTQSPHTPILTKDEIENELVLVSDSHQAIFDLSKEEDRFSYKWVWDRIVNGWFHLVHIERHWDDDKKTLYVYMEWVQTYAQQPTKAG